MALYFLCKLHKILHYSDPLSFSKVFCYTLCILFYLMEEKHMKKLLGLLAMLLSLILAASFSAFAAQSQPEGAPGEGDASMSMVPGGPGGPGDSEGAAATTIYTITEDGLLIDEEAGTYTLEGEVGETESDEIDLTIDSFGTNGFKITAGEYTIKNSVITANVTDEIDPNDAGGYCAGVTGGTLILENDTFTTNGKGGRAGNYTVDCEGDGKLIVINSNIIQTGLSGDPEGYTAAIADPPSNAALGISGYARANMSIGHSQTWYYGSYVEAEGWAAMSTDSAQSGFTFTSYDSIGKALYGGYGTYADTSCVDWFYGSVLSSAEVGAIISNNGEIHMANGEAADEAALAYLPEDYEVSEEYLEREGRSLVEAGRNDFQLHSPDMGGAGAGSDYHAILDLADTDIITSEELDANATLVDWYEDYGPAMGEYIDFVKGANILVKSTGSYITLDNVTAQSSSDVLLLTALNSDSMSRYAHADNDMTGKGTELTITDCDITGDVDHFDYQRNCVVTLENSTWSGAYVAIDKETWDGLWSDECKDDESCYWILDPETYFDGEGTTAALIIDADSTWNVTGESYIDILTAEAGAVIHGTVTVDGEEIDTTEGGTWEGDIIVTPAK